MSLRLLPPVLHLVEEHTLLGVYIIHFSILSLRPTSVSAFLAMLLVCVAAVIGTARVKSSRKLKQPSTGCSIFASCCTRHHSLVNSHQWPRFRECNWRERVSLVQSGFDEEFHCVAFLLARDRSCWLRVPLCFECQEVWCSVLQCSQALCPR